jgi:hypothetical protein
LPGCGARAAGRISGYVRSVSVAAESENSPVIRAMMSAIFFRLLTGGESAQAVAGR